MRLLPSSTGSRPSFVADRSGRPRRVHWIAETVDDSECCINCGVLELRNATGHQPWRRLAIVSIIHGNLETLEEWPLCPNCETSQGATLVQYVRLKLT
jgi:hypothetical protein